MDRKTGAHLNPQSTSATPPRVAPYGSWDTPITASLVARAGVSLAAVSIEKDIVYWLETRPYEGGRGVIVRRLPDGTIEPITPEGFNVHSRVHEYGGGDYVVHEDTVYFSNHADQRLYRQRSGAAPVPITPEPEVGRDLRYADGRVTPDGRHLICVRETHLPGEEAVNELVVLPTDGSAPPRTLASGRDFYSSPRLAPGGRILAWLCWDHPCMPWDGTELWTAEIQGGLTLAGARRIAGGPAESIFQPEWSPDGVLHFISDRSGWWNLYAERDGAIEPLAPTEAELGTPQWVFGLSRYAFLSGGRIACVYGSKGIDHLGLIHPRSGRIEPLDTRFTYFGRGGTIRSDGEERLVFVGATPSRAPAVISRSGGTTEVLRESLSLEVDPAYLSAPRPIEFPTEGGRTAFALYYPPANSAFCGPEDERPPLLVRGHGGPTSASTSELKLETQFFTSRGFGVVDVNYGGSSGYGRAYRDRLRGSWGVVDTEDCINAALHLARQGEIDRSRMAIRGGSAGGYTVLCALVFHDVFTTGASYYGVADLELLATDTHKFESRYLDSMVGPYPEKAALYRERSPLHFTDRLSCPVILFQGLEDRVVPPSQAEVLVRSLREKKLPHAYLTFSGEAHGFRRAETIERTLSAELYFYSRFFGFEPAGKFEPVRIEGGAGAGEGSP
jgi:dipeptidyl aminopeptidase/acylaminoacyl peptidase